jgi:hypothetical protein
VCHQKRFQLVSGLPDFSWFKHIKTGEYTNHMTICKMYTKRLWIIPNYRKIFQIVMKHNNIFHLTDHPIYPNWNFWLENKPSGRPGWCDGEIIKNVKQSINDFLDGLVRKIFVRKTHLHMGCRNCVSNTVLEKWLRWRFSVKFIIILFMYIIVEIQCVNDYYNMCNT